MDDWERQLLTDVRRAMAGSLWGHDQSAPSADGRAHLVVLVEPYLSGLMSGTKTVESRFSRHRRPPYRTVHVSDRLILKRSAGPVVGVCRVAEAHFHEIAPGVLEQARRQFGHALGIPRDDATFWEDRAAMKYATFLRITDVKPLPPIACAKRDQRGWVVLRTGIGGAAS